MVWKKPTDDKYEHDPWSNKEEGSNKLKNNNKKKSYFLKKIINTFYFLKYQYKLFFSNFHFFRVFQNPVTITLTIFIVGFITSGFYIIKESERGVFTYLGRFSHIVKPGLNWRPILLSSVIPVNIEEIRELSISDTMLTADENIVRIDMNVQYRVINPKQYLFSVINPDNSLQQAANSALRNIISHVTIDCILTKGRTSVKNNIQKAIETIIQPYNMGLIISDVNVQKVSPPELIKSFFDNVISAKENRQKLVREAETYANEVIPKANERAHKILEQAKMYMSKITLKAEGDIIKFLKILPEYKNAKAITIQRLRIELMEKILSNTKKIFIDSHTKVPVFFILDKSIFNNRKVLNLSSLHKFNKNNILDKVLNVNTNKNGILESKLKNNDIMAQRRMHAFRTDHLQEGLKLNNE